MSTGKKVYFGDKLRALRLQQGLTQVELGKRVGLSSRMIVHYEKHATRPPADKVMALANALGLSADKLLKDTSTGDPHHVDPKFARKLERAKQLPPGDQVVLAGIIDNFLQKNGLTQKRKKRKSVKTLSESRENTA